MQRVNQKQRECLVLPCQTGEEADRQVRQREFCPQSSPPKPQSDTFRSLIPCKVSPCSSICHNILIFSYTKNEIWRILLFVLSVRRLLRKTHLYLGVRMIYVMDFLVQIEEKEISLHSIFCWSINFCIHLLLIIFSYWEINDFQFLVL